MLIEYQSLSDAAKVKSLEKGEKCYYLFFTGTREECRSKGLIFNFFVLRISLRVYDADVDGFCFRFSIGLCSSLIRHYQSIAANESTPICLEATTAYSRDLYAKLGFQEVDEMLLGKGKVGADGKLKKNGEGVRIWAMVWRPKLHQNE